MVGIPHFHFHIFISTIELHSLYSGHTSFVNSCQSTRRGVTQIVSGSDDCSVKVWDPRKKGQCVTLNNIYQVTAVTFNDTAEQVISGGIDNDLKVS